MRIEDCQDFLAVHRFLKGRCRIGSGRDYLVPAMLLNGGSSTRLVKVRNPHAFFASVFEGIAERQQVRREAALSASDLVYQSFIQTFASLNSEPGTALKQIAFLEFLRSRLGLTVFLSLPTGTIGFTNRKGNRGSPFAVKNPFAIDASLADPLLEGVPATVQYRALVQACRLLGIRAGSVVPMTTLSMDCPLFKAFPALGYWWEAEPGELLYATAANWDCCSCRDGRTSPIIGLGQACKARFVEAPEPGQVKTISRNGDVYFVAEVERNGLAKTVTLANAFPDPVPGELNDYTWRDVASVRYGARCYPPSHGEREIDIDRSQPAWRVMPHVIGWRARELGEEVFLVDVNEKVPAQILSMAHRVARGRSHSYGRLLEELCSPELDEARASEVCEILEREGGSDDSGVISERLDFIAEELWRFELENTSVSAIVGPFVFCVSAHSHNMGVFVDSLRYHLKLLESSPRALPYFAGLGNHDTIPPRAEVARALCLIYFFLPRGVPMLFSGHEHQAQVITNKEFGFSSAQLVKLRDSLREEDLALFNELPIDWDAVASSNRKGEFQMIPFLECLRKLRHCILGQVSDEALDFEFLEVPGAEWCFGFRRMDRERPEHSIVVYVNWSQGECVTVVWPYSTGTVLMGLFWPLGEVVEKGASMRLGPGAAVLLGVGDFRRLQGQSVVEEDVAAGLSVLEQ